MAFANSSEVKYDRRGPMRRSSLAAALGDDLEDHFHEAATTAVKTLTGAQVRLGYKLLE